MIDYYYNIQYKRAYLLSSIKFSITASRVSNPQPEGTGL